MGCSVSQPPSPDPGDPGSPVASSYGSFWAPFNMQGSEGGIVHAMRGGGVGVELPDEADPFWPPMSPWRTESGPRAAVPGGLSGRLCVGGLSRGARKRKCE